MKKTLLLFLLLPFFGFAQGLSGDYIISRTNSLAKFESLSSAITKLEQVGFDGPVKFLLDEDQVVTSQYIIKEYTNSSKTNTLTIKPNSDKNIVITAKKPNDYTAIPAIFLFNGATNVIIDGSNSNSNTKNLTLINDDAINSVRRSIIWIASNGTKGSSNITVKNSNFRFSFRNQQLTLLTGVYSGSNQYGGNNSVGEQTNTASNSNISIINNEMFNVKDGININGNSNNTLSPTDWKIQGNKIGNTTNNETQKPVRGIYISNALNYEISGNSISGIRNTENQGNDCAAIVLLGSSNGTISSNTIDDIANNQHNNSYFTAGILVKSTGITNIFNNIISKVYNTTANSENGNFYNKGNNIFIASGSTTNIYYNTIIGSGAPTGTTRASCLYISGGSSINVRNNIFVNTQSGIQYAIFNNGGTLGTISHNNYYVTNSSNGFSNRIGGQSGTEYIGTGSTGVTAWNQATSDNNSRIINPSFSSDFHLQDVSNNNNLQAVSIPEVTTDIDGDARVKPYIGADEILKCVPAGDQITYGENKWIGYVYRLSDGVPTSTIPNPNNATTFPISNLTYIGQVEESTILFNRDVVKGVVTGVNPQLCETPSDYFFVRYKMKTKVATTGTYNITLGGDDYYRLYINGQKISGLEQWSGQNYSQKAINITLTKDVEYTFDIEYYERTTDSRVQFSMGLIASTTAQPYTYPFGENLWNVYGFTTAREHATDFSIPSNSYAGFYSVTPVDINTTNSFALTESPSFDPVKSGWQGAPVPQDHFTLVYKRHGFPCGTYQIQITNCDDLVQIYIDDENVTAPAYTSPGNIFPHNPANNVLTSPRVLGKNSKVEIRFKDYKNTARLNLNFIKIETDYNGSGNANGSSLVISADTELTTDLTVCSCTINDGVTLTVPKDITLTVDEDINVIGEGKLLLLDGGSLLQTSTDKNMFSGGANTFEAQRTTKVVRYDVTYWSSPVVGLSMHDLSPDTLWDKYHYWNAANNGWVLDSFGKEKMEAGRGYSIRAPQTHDLETPHDFTAKFIGKPNNGDVSIPLVVGNLNLLGNPYPSSIDAEQFIIDNGDVGPLYFWSHNTPPKRIEGTNIFTYDSADFAVFTLMGETQPSPKGQRPNGYISTGQGFFVRPKVNSVLFTNDQRVKAKNTSFFKTTAKTSGIEKNRLWLNLTNTGDAFKQILIGYATGATNSLDHNFDATSMNSNSYLDFYSINTSKKLTIQGRALPFDNTDVVPLGFKSTVAGEFTISIDHADGFFETQEVYLEDKLTGKITDLRKENYTFTTAVGSFNTRFSVRYTNKTLGTDDFENIGNSVLVAVKSKVINLTSGTENIKETQIYTIGGQLLFSKNKIEAKELKIENLHSSNQVLLVKVILENDHVVTKKIIFN